AGRCRYSPKTSRKVDHAPTQRQGPSRAKILVEIPVFQDLFFPNNASSSVVETSRSPESVWWLARFTAMWTGFESTR
ncbi:MAG: hypothetical protein JRN15_22655, partial [Nitrososphaerota archaeon]|nr:hypothetical protein [Nitrososphaerota archaeon]